MKARLIRERNGFTARIDNEAVYWGIKSGKLAFEEHHKKDIRYYMIPASVFERLLEMDRNWNVRLKNLLGFEGVTPEDIIKILAAKESTDDVQEEKEAVD